MLDNSYMGRKKRYDSFPFQVQAWRENRWNVVSSHMTAATAQKGLAQIRKCQPGSPHLYRQVHCTSDNYIWVDPSNKQSLQAS